MASEPVSSNADDDDHYRMDSTRLGSTNREHLNLRGAEIAAAPRFAAQGGKTSTATRALLQSQSAAVKSQQEPPHHLWSTRAPTPS